MFREFYDALYLGLSNAIVLVLANESDPVKILPAAMQEIRKTLDVLRVKVLSVPFPSMEIEILFFKKVKPKFYALKIYHFELYGLVMGIPVGTKEVVLAYYAQELVFIARFFSIHSGAYDYFRTGRTELDHVYFVRGAEAAVVVSVPEMSEIDPLYVTSMDYLFAKFIAYEALQGEIVKRIGVLDGSLVAADVPGPDLGLKWTGKIVNLGELIYGLYYTGQLNHGNAQLSEIVALFERMFMVKIRDVHHTFGEIRERKVSSPSKFIDSMAAAIRDRVDEDLKYKPR